jgi:hypothetical protein
MAVRREFPSVRTVRVSFWVLRHRVQRVVKTAEDALSDERELMTVADEIRGCSDPEGRPSGLCPWCPYEKQCPARRMGVKQRWRLKNE